MDSVPATARPRSCILLTRRQHCPWHVRPHPELAALYLYEQYYKYKYRYQYGESTCHCEESQLHLAKDTTALSVASACARTSPSGISRTISICTIL